MGKRKGSDARTLWINAILEELETTSWRAVTIPALGRRAHLMSTGFYQYWPTLDAALLDIAQESARAVASPRLQAILRLVQLEDELGVETRRIG